MTKYKINGEVVMTGKSHEETGQLVAKSSALIKTMAGIGNNAAWSCCIEALEHLREHPNYRHRVKQGFLGAMRALKTYESHLLHTKDVRLFHVDDLAPEYRNRYGDISDREYYEFWANTGAQAYATKRAWATSLQNKFRLSLISHGVRKADIVAWGMTADALLTLAVCIYENSIHACVADYGVPEKLLNGIFGQLNISHIEKMWAAAMTELEPYTSTFDLTPSEQKNIQYGLDQVQEQWTSTATLADTLKDTIEAYDDIFRSKKEMKRALWRVAEMRDEHD